MKNAVVPASDFDLAATLECGQVFHWRRTDAGYVGMIGDVPFWVQQSGAELHVPAGGEALARHYFALDHPLREICETFPKDPAMEAAGLYCHGLRIIRQPAWECVATFITSALKQVAHIAQISHILRERFGEPHAIRGTTLYSYPTPARIAALTEADLRACALGFRAKNLLATARLVAAGEIDLGALDAMSDANARAALCRLPGVGEKVANCALLFGFGRLRAFPVDVWIERVLREIYFARKRKVTARRLRDFSASYFGEYSGYAQQYLFHHARTTRRKGG